jgi:hypothetical protein
MTTTKGRIVSGGCGGFLNPPPHPENFISVEIDLNRKKEDRGVLSLSYAIECDWLDRQTRHAARYKLNTWRRNRPPLSDSTIQDWILNVLGYFRDTYIHPYGSRNVRDLFFSKELNPLSNAHLHAGVAFIRDFYPEYVPTVEHFKQAYWGKKPS